MLKKKYNNKQNIDIKSEFLFKIIILKKYELLIITLINLL